MKRSIIWLLVFGLGVDVYAQSQVVFSHYMVNPTKDNPAFVGWDNITHITLQVRSQWTGYQSTFDGAGGAPTSQAVTASVPVLGGISGLGLSIINDDLGPVNNFILNIPVSHTINLNSSSLQIGLMPGIFSQTLRFDELRFNDESDPLNIGSRETQQNFNLAAGMVYTLANDLYMGVSVVNITEPSFNFGLEGHDNQLVRSYNFLSGYRQTIVNNISINPSVNIRTDLNSFSFDLSTLVHFNQRGWAGLSYRWEEALIFMVGYSFLADNKLQVGYALDYVIDEQDAKQPTSQEILLRYNIPEFVLGGRKQVKTPRFTY